MYLDPLNPGGRAFIDGGSLFHTMRYLERDTIDWHALMSHIASMMRGSTFRAKPRLSLNHLVEYNRAWWKNAAVAGFKVKELSRRSDLKHIQSKDDADIIKHIDECTPAITNRIVLVSADIDFLPAVERALQKGIAITWAAPFNVRGDYGTHMVGKKLAHRLVQGDIDREDLGHLANIFQKQAKASQV